MFAKEERGEYGYDMAAFREDLSCFEGVCLFMITCTVDALLLKKRGPFMLRRGVSVYGFVHCRCLAVKESRARQGGSKRETDRRFWIRVRGVGRGCKEYDVKVWRKEQRVCVLIYGESESASWQQVCCALNHMSCLGRLDGL